MTGLAPYRRRLTPVLWITVMVAVALVVAGYWYDQQHGLVGHRVDLVAIPATSAFQSELLADGFISRSEYRAANEAYAECLREAGIPTRGPIDILRPGFVVVNYDIVESDAGGWAEQSACASTYTNVVNGVYFAQAIPQGSEIDIAKSEMVRCLLGTGTSSLDSGTSLAVIAAEYFEGRMAYEEAYCIHLHLPLLYVEDIEDH